jgi:hypothetical protein
LNATYSEHEAPAASEVPHVPISSNEVALVPPTVIELIVTVTVLVFFTVTICASLVAPTAVAGKAMDVGVRVTVGVFVAAPVPLSFTTCGEPVALSAIESEAVKAPAAAGLNSTDTVQLAPAASEVPHVVADLMNEVALVPVIVSEVSVNAAVPEFFTVTTCAAVVAPTVVEANVNEVGDNVTAGFPVATPVPLSATSCGDPVALSAIESEAAKAPAAAGLNSTDTVQLAPAASEVVHVVADFKNEVALVPVIVSEVSVSAAVPEFFTVTTCAAVVTPTVVEANVNDVGVSVTAGAVVVVGHAFTRLVTFIVPSPVVRSYPVVAE